MADYLWKGKVMLVNFDPLRSLENDRRTHPWNITAYTERGGMYYDFISNPSLINQSLEDFKPHDEQEAVQTFYSFLKWINGNGSHLETNDCALRDFVIPNNDKLFKFSHKIDGRLEFFFRDHNHNCDVNLTTWLMRMLSLYLQVERSDFFNAIIDIQLAPTEFLSLPVHECEGHRIRITFSAYGHGDTDVWKCLNTVFHSLWEATKRLNHAIEEGDNPTFP